MLVPNEPDSDEQDLADIAAAQHRLIQLLAKAVAERLANRREIRESHSDRTDEQP